MKIRRPPDTPALSEGILLGPVSERLRRPAARIEYRMATPLGGEALNQVTGGVYKLSGIAYDQSGSHPWSLVLKLLHPPPAGGELRPTHPYYWRREAFVYASGLLGGLSEDFRSPRCLGIADLPDGALGIFLDEVPDAYDSRWPLSRFESAAFQLGRFNGIYLERDLPAFPWLIKDFLREWLSVFLTGDMRAFWTDDSNWRSEIRHALPPSLVRDLLKAYENCGESLRILDHLPQTFCHYDTWRPNLITERRGDGTEVTCAIDWAFTGTGPLGGDINQLITLSLMRFDTAIDTAETMDSILFESYIKGLSSTGWSGAVHEVRFCHAVTAYIRTGLRVLSFLRRLNDDANEPFFEKKFEKGTEEILTSWSRLLEYLRVLHDESMDLLKSI